MDTLLREDGTASFGEGATGEPSATSGQPSHHTGEEYHGDSDGDGGASGSHSTRASKKPRLVWTPELHARFMNAVNHLGVKNAVPKTILQLMNVEGMTRENVASHLQKYRLYLKRLAGFPAGAKVPPDTLQRVQQQAMQQLAQQQAIQRSVAASFAAAPQFQPFPSSPVYSASPEHAFNPYGGVAQMGVPVGMGYPAPTLIHPQPQPQPDTQPLYGIASASEPSYDPAAAPTSTFAAAMAAYPTACMPGMSYMPGMMPGMYMGMMPGSSGMYGAHVAAAAAPATAPHGSLPAGQEFTAAYAYPGMTPWGWGFGMGMGMGMGYDPTGGAAAAVAPVEAVTALGGGEVVSKSEAEVGDASGGSTDPAMIGGSSAGSKGQAGDPGQ